MKIYFSINKILIIFFNLCFICSGIKIQVNSNKSNRNFTSEYISPQLDLELELQSIKEQIKQIGQNTSFIDFHKDDLILLDHKDIQKSQIGFSKKLVETQTVLNDFSNIFDNYTSEIKENFKSVNTTKNHLNPKSLNETNILKEELENIKSRLKREKLNVSLSINPHYKKLKSSFLEYILAMEKEVIDSNKLYNLFCKINKEKLKRDLYKRIKLHMNEQIVNQMVLLENIRKFVYDQITMNSYIKKDYKRSISLSKEIEAKTQRFNDKLIKNKDTLAREFEIAKLSSEMKFNNTRIN